jgi:hypothetical protein
MARGKEKYTLSATTFRTLVHWAHAGVCSMIGKAHCHPEDRKLVFDFARETGIFSAPPEAYNVVQAAPRPVPQIEATAKLASAPGPDEIRRRELASGAKTS